MVGGRAGQGSRAGRAARPCARPRPARPGTPAESSSPEHEQVTSNPPGSTSFIASTFRSKYFRLPGAISSRSGISLGGSRTTTPKVLPLTPIWRSVAERVGVNHFEPDLVGVAVFARQGDGLLVEVDAGDLPRLAADQGVQAEAAGVAAQVQHGPVGAEPGELAAVVALIAEEARLVPLLEMDAVADPVLGDGHAGRELRAGQRPARKVFLLRDPLVDVHAKMGGPQPFGEQSDRIGPIR